MTRARHRPVFGATIAAIFFGTACAAPPEAKTPASGPQPNASESAPPAAPARTGAPAGATAEAVDESGAPAAAQARPTVPAPAPQPASEPADGARQREAALRTARTELEEAQRDLETSMSECAAACRALGSMERATGHLCDLAMEHDDRKRCEDAKTTVLRTREKVRASCGSCPGGPSLEKGAPIPSRR